MPKVPLSTASSLHKCADVHEKAENEKNVACYSGASANSTNCLLSDVINLANSVNDDALQGHCHVCGKNIQHMSLQFQTQHINRCLDQSEKAEPPVAVSNVTTRPLVLDCPICGQPLKTENSRRLHLKKCANKFNVSLPELMDIIKRQEEHRQIMQSDMIPDHVPVSHRGRSRSTVTTVPGRKRLHKDRLEEPKSKFDEDTHLAIALSIHETESADQLRESEKPIGDDGDEQLSKNAGLKPDLFTILMSSEMSKIRDQPAGKKSKKKLQSREPLPLLATDQSELKRKIELKVSDMIRPSSSTDNCCGSQGQFPSRCLSNKMLQFPESRVRNKYILSNESQGHPETKLWSETSTASDSKDSYYVKDLEPFISICSSTGLSAAIQRKCPVASVHSSSTTANVADVTLYTSTQTAVDLAELAAEIGDQTVFLDDETFRSPETEIRDVAKVVANGTAQCSLQSHKDEVTSEAVSDLLKDLRCLIDDPNHSDLMLCCQNGDAIYSHRLIIGVRCPKLIEMADSCNKVDLTDFSRKSVLSLVHFLYTGDTNVSITVVSELKRLANRLQMPKLSCLCDSITIHDSSMRLENTSSRINDSVTTKSVSACSLQEDTEDERTAEEKEWNEVHDFFVTQLKKAADNAARDLSEGETAGINAAADDDEGNDNDAISSDTDGDSDTVDAKKACSGEDDDVYLSQALLHKLEESFSASGGAVTVGRSTGHANDDAGKMERNSCRDNDTDENELAARSPLNDCSSYDSDAIRDNSPMRSRSETDEMELNEPNDPCDGRYDQIDVDVEQQQSVDGETVQALCSTLPETGQSTYSAVSPLSMFDEDSLSGNDDCNGGPLLVSIPTSVLSSSIYKTPESRNVNPEQNNQFSPGHCLSPDDLFKSPSCVDEELSSFTLGDQLPRSSLRAFGSNRICEPSTEVTTTNKAAAAAAAADDDKHALIDLPDTIIRNSNKCTAAEDSRSRCLENADVECLPDNGSSPVIGVAAPSSNWQWFDDVEPDSDVDLNSNPSTHTAGAVSVIKRCSKASSDYCENNTETADVSQCPPEINVVVIDDDDDDDDVVEPSQSLRDKSRLSNSVNVDQTKVCESETIAARNRLSTSEQSFTCEDVVADVWEGFDEGYAAGYYCADLNTSTSSGRLVTTASDRRSTDSIAVGTSQQRISRSPAFPAAASLVKLREFNTSISGRANMSYSQPSSAAETSTTPKTPVITEQVYDDCDLPNVLSSPELAAYSPPTDMDTDVSALMDQLAANNAFGPSDDSFEAVKGRDCSTAAVNSKTTSKSRLKTAITPMPDYKQMVTPALKLQCKKFGVRALPKQKMVKVLEDIYFGTHPAVERPVEEEKKRPKKRTAPTSTDSSLETRTRQLPGPKKTSKLKRSNESADVESLQPAKNVDVSSKPVYKSLTLSDSSSDCSSSTDSTDDSDHENVPEESVMYSPEKQKNKQVSLRGLDESSKKKLLCDYIKSKTELYQKTLLYEPLELDEFVNELKDNGIKLPAKDVVNFLDELNILFTTRKSQTGWASRRAGNKKRTQKTRKPKNKSTTSVSDGD